MTLDHDDLRGVAIEWLLDSKGTLDGPPFDESGPKVAQAFALVRIGDLLVDLVEIAHARNRLLAGIAVHGHGHEHEPGVACPTCAIGGDS